MATTPRAGIINLNFKDVSEMAKNIADNDPWKLGIEAAGKVLTDRERYVMYQRALADAQGKERPEDKTAGELIGSGIETAGELIGSGIDGAGSALSWLGDKAGKGIDKLRALMPSETIEKSLTEETENETPSEKGSREMIGYVPNQSPIETDKYRTNLKAPERVEVQPNDEISFGFNADIGQAEQQPSPIIPFGTGEQVPEDTEEAPVVAPEKAQESGSPFEATEVAETKIKAPRMSEMEAWSEMNRLDPQRAAFDYNRVKTEADKKKVEKEKTQSLLKEVASDFANFDPTDQGSWTEARDRWIDINPNLGSFIPEQASQDAWDRIQTQGGLGKNVAPKGEFAQRKYIEDQVKQATFLSATARAANKTAEADFYANKALTLQKGLDGIVGGDTKTVDQIVEKYATEIKALEKATTKDRLADTTALFSTISKELGEGAPLEAVKTAINDKLQKELEAKGGITQYSDDEQQKKAAIYDGLAKVLSENKAKVRSAISLIKKKIPSGGARIAAKTLQGDVLAESEFSSYKNSNPLNQALSNWANKFAGVSFISEQDAQNLVDALIETYNASAGDYLKALRGNKYKDSTVELLSAQRIFGGAGKGKTGGDTYPMRQTKNGIKYIKKSANGSWEREK